MNFRLVWVGSDDDPPVQQPSTLESGDAVRAGRATPRYEQAGTEMVRCQRLTNGRLKRIAVANFSVRIVRDLIVDDDAEQRRELGIEAELAGQRLAFVVSAAEFGRMDWVLRRLGPQAIIYPGQQQHARAAIQWLSGSIRQERILTHLGWRKHGADWVYLHAGGPIGAQGARSDLRVELPAALSHYQIQLPANGQEQVGAVRASLSCLSVAPDRISIPLLAAVYRAALGAADFSLFLTGRTGTFKTALAALCQQHFGAAMEASRLPANFSSTGNALESLAFSAKDALLVVDDFVPTGGPGDNALHGLAERLFRAAGNHQGRNRMSGDGRMRASHPPRGLVLATGEEVPRGQSIRARMLIVQLRPAEVDRSRLSHCQIAARQGQLAAAMGAFLSWSAGHYEELQQRLQTRSGKLRNQHGRGALHARLPAALAELQSAWEIWLEFALEIGAIDSAKRAQLERRRKRAFQELAELQIRYHQAGDPALRFVALLRAAFASGHAHVADRSGKNPESPESWGWRRKPSARAWVPQGTRVGWIARSDLFLDPTLSYQMVQQLAGDERLPVSERTLRHQLRERGLLVSTDLGRQMLTVRRTLEGIPRQVLHLRASDLAIE